MLKKQVDFIRSKTDFIPDIAIVLGSGLGDFAKEIDDICSVDYKDIPGFPVSTAPLHAGRLVMGTLHGARVICMQGRVHFYEGYSAKQIASPIRLMRALGAKTLILTNASGGISKDLNAGDLMIIDDHISCFVDSPLIGANDESIGPRFPDMSDVYSKRLRGVISKCAVEAGIDIKSGTYVQLKGPAFETKAEIKMLARLGADAVGMSTAIEAQAGRHCGFEVCAISVITNLACGLTNKPVTAEEVSETADKSALKFKELLIKTIESINDGKY